MGKIKALSGFVSKLNNGARFVKVCIRSIEFFKEELDKEFPDDTLTLNPVSDVSELSK